MKGCESSAIPGCLDNLEISLGGQISVKLQQQEGVLSSFVAEEVLIPNEGARTNIKLILLFLTNPRRSDEVLAHIQGHGQQWEAFGKVTVVPSFSACLD